MGNGQAKPAKNFFDEIKGTTSYRDFVIKMNQLMAKNNVSWELSFEPFSPQELGLYEDLLKHFLCFSADYLLEVAVRKPAPDRESLRMARAFLGILQKMFVFLAVQKPGWFYEALWTRVSQDLALEREDGEGGAVRQVKVEGRDFIGAQDQFTLGMKFLAAAAGLLFKNHFCVEYKIEERERLQSAVAQGGWVRSAAGAEVVASRVALLEFALTFILAERRFCELYGLRNNAVLAFFRRSKIFEASVKSLVHAGCSYKENGLLPYSAYFYREQLEGQLYLSALALNAALLLLGEDCEAARAEFRAPGRNLALFLVKSYLRNQNLLEEGGLADVFEDEAYLLGVLELIAENIISLYTTSKTFLPHSFKPVR